MLEREKKLRLFKGFKGLGDGQMFLLLFARDVCLVLHAFSIKGGSTKR